MRADAGQAGRTKHLPAPPVTRPKERLSRTDQTEWAPWGLQLIGTGRKPGRLPTTANCSCASRMCWGEGKALVLRGRMAGRGSAPWYRFRVAESSRARTDESCAPLERQGEGAYARPP
jgi:hypothetical protein